MKLRKFSELILYAAGVGVSALVWINVQGRAVNSPSAYKLSAVPIIGPLIDSLRSITNQVYDVTGEA